MVHTSELDMSGGRRTVDYITTNNAWRHRLWLGGIGCNFQSRKEPSPEVTVSKDSLSIPLFAHERGITCTADELI